MPSAARRIAILLAGILTAGVGIFAISTPAYASTRAQLRLQEAGNMCLEVVAGSQSNGALTHMNNCYTDRQYQQFYFFYVPGSGSPGQYQIVARHSGKCLDVQGVSYAVGAPVQQYDCLGYGQLNQIWQRVDSGAPHIRFYAMHSGQWLRSFGLYPGAPVGQDTYPYILWFQVPA